MPTATFQYRDEPERLAIEAAISFVSEMRHLAQTAPDAQVISLCEGAALDRGRDLLRSTLRGAVQSRIAEAEKKEGRPAPARAAAASATSGATAPAS